MSEKTESNPIKSLLELLKQNWIDAGIELNTLATEDEIRDFESQYQVKFPVDFREFFLHLNGINQAVDMCRLWPLAEITRFTSLFPIGQPLNLEHAFTSETKPELPNAEWYFIFGDYGFSAGYWAINLHPTSENNNSIIIAYSSRVYAQLPLGNFTEFVKGLLENPHVFLI